MNDMITDPLAAAEAKALREAEKKVQAPLDETGGLAPRMAPDVSPGEVIAGGFEAEAIETDRWFLSDREYRRLLDPAFDRAAVAHGLAAESELGTEAPGFAGRRGGYEMLRDPLAGDGDAAVLAWILEGREKRPDLFAGIPVTREEILAAANAKIGAEYADAQETLGRAPDTFLGRTVPEFLGRMGAAATDEINLPLSALAGGVEVGANLGRLVLTEAGVSVIGEALTIPKQFDMADRLDIEDPNVALQLTFAATVGAALPLGLAGAGKALSYGGRAVAATNRQLVKAYRARFAELAPEERAAVQAIERQVAEEDTGPAARGIDNVREADHAAAAIEAGEPPSPDAPPADPARVESLTTPPPAAVPEVPAPRPLEASLSALIRDAEARGSYDTFSDYTVIAPPKALTDMTLDEIDAWQSDNIAAGAASSAAGGIQIIRDTLRGVRARLGLKGDERFDGAMQDRLATELMRDAGLDDYKAGRITAEDFADGLARVWAAFPLADGRSYYAGDGLNAATIDRDTILSVITGREYVSTGRPAPRMSRVAAAGVRVDPRTYQFRTAVDAAGVGTPMDRVTAWDELLAGDFIIHERMDGARYIADGHHRKQLADRLMSQGHAPIEFNAFVLREADGYTVEHVRAIAAVKNIEAGNASAVDAAKVLRVDPAMLEKLTLRNSQARDARGLMQLSDDAFDMVTNGLVREDFAAFVPSLTRDAQMQEAILRALIRVKPRSLAEARQVAADAHRAGIAKAEAGSQASLFGDDFDPAETLFKERAEVMARALAQLRNDKRVFATLVRERDRIERAGNELTDDNAVRVSTDETALALIEKLVNRAGPLDDALNAAARGVRAGGSVSAAVTDFLGSVRGAVEGGGLGRLLDGADGRPLDADAAPDGAAQGAGGRGAEGGSPDGPAGPEARGEAGDAGDDAELDAELGDFFGAAVEGLNRNSLEYADVPPVRDEAAWGAQAPHKPEAEIFPKIKKAERRLIAAEKPALIRPEEAAVRLADWKAEAARMGREEDHSGRVILSLFDHTGNWSRPWEEAGFRVLRYDIESTEFQDLLEFFPTADLAGLWARDLEVYGVLSACPCTTFAASGARWWKGRHDVPDAEMVEKMFGPRMARYFDTPLEANKALAEVTRAIVDLANPTAFHVLENPRGRIRTETDLPEARLVFDPNHFGDPYTKETFLFGTFNSDLPLAPVEPTEGSKIQSKLRGDRPEDKAERSKTPEGFAYSFFMANRPTDGGRPVPAARPIEVRTKKAKDPRLAELGEIVKAGATREEIDAHPVLTDALAKMDAAPETRLAEGYGSDAWHAGRRYLFDGEEVIGTAAALDRWKEAALRLAWDETGAAFPGLQPGGREATFLLGPPAAGKSTIANEIAIARGAAILDSDEIKKSIPEFDGGVGASAVHEESSDLAAALEADLLADGYNLVVPKVGGSAASIEKAIGRFRAAGYSIRLVNMAVTPENAYKRMIGRFVSSGRLIPPTYVDFVGAKPSAVFRELKQKGLADGYAEIDNNGGLGEPKPVSELDGANPLEGSRLDPRAGGRNRPGDLAGSSEDPDGAAQAGELSERTAAGDQLVTPGTRPITDTDRLQALMSAPKRGGNAPADAGLFDLGARDQLDMFAAGGRVADLFGDPRHDAPELVAQADAAERDLRAALAAGELFDVPTGRMVDERPELVGAADLFADLDADQEFLGVLDACK